MVGRCIQCAVCAAVEPLEKRLFLSLVPVYNLQIEVPANPATAERLDVSHGQGLEVIGLRRSSSTALPKRTRTMLRLRYNNRHSNGIYLHNGESFARCGRSADSRAGFN